MKYFYLFSFALLGMLGTQLSAQTTYLWSTGATTPTISVNPTVTTTYYVTITHNGVQYLDSLTVEVNPAPTITGQNSICSGGTTQLTGSGTPAAQDPWVSSNTNVATVSETGLLNALSIGSTTITYTNNDGCTNTFEVTVTQGVTGVDVINSCGPITWIDGNIYSQSNNTATFNIVGGAANGCDSLVTLNLTVTTPPAQPTLACYETATFNSTTCQWDVTGTQPTAPTNLACWEIATFNENTCQWEVTGTQPNEPTLACYETATFNSTTCQWDVTGTQPTQPTLACYETANFNTTTCQWEVTGTQPNEPNVSFEYVVPSLSAFYSGPFYGLNSVSNNPVGWSWNLAPSNDPTLDASGNAGRMNLVGHNIQIDLGSATPSSVSYFLQNIGGGNKTLLVQYSSNGSTWITAKTHTQSNLPIDVTTFHEDLIPNDAKHIRFIMTVRTGGRLSIDGITVNGTGTNGDQILACYESYSFNSATCQWEVTGTQPTQPTNLACWQTSNFNTTTCQWEVTGSQPSQPTLACHQTASFNGNTCQWEVSGTQAPAPTASAQVFCGTTTVAQLVSSSSSPLWHTSAVGGTPLAPNASVTTNTYYASELINGCESLRSPVSITVNPLAQGIDIIASCQPIVWIDGNTYSSSNSSATFLFSGGSANGCDSIVTLNFTLHQPTSGIDVIGSCGPMTWIDGNTYSSSNYTATHLLPGANQYGCDSLVTLNLTIVPCTQLQATDCNISQVGIIQTIRATNVSGAAVYRFRINGANDGSPGWVNNTYILDRNNRAMKFDMIPGVVFGATYTIDVAISLNGINFGGFGNTCTASLQTNPTTQIEQSFCGSTDLNPNTTLLANAFTGIVTYRFRFTGINNGASGWNNNVYIIDRPNRGCKLSLIPGLVWGSAYTVDVAVLGQNAVEFGPYGPPCSFTYYTLTTQMEDISCNATDVSISATLRANSVSGATGYRFKITGNHLPAAGWDGDVYILDRPTRDFKFNMIPGVLWSESYDVEVALLNQAGTSYGPYGNSCNITIEFPTTTMEVTSCDVSGVLLTTNLRANNNSTALGYRFKITGNNTGAVGWNGNELILDRPTRVFRFNMFEGALAGETYQVEVALLSPDGVTYGPYGAACSVTLSTTLMQEAINDADSANSIFEVQASHNPFSKDFGLQVITNQDNLPIHVIIYDMAGKLIESSTIYPIDIESARFGKHLAAGMYMVEVKQGSNQVLVRQVKD